MKLQSTTCSWDHASNSLMPGAVMSPNIMESHNKSISVAHLSGGSKNIPSGGSKKWSKLLVNELCYLGMC